ncbi:MAG: helix-turn-helix transcriptional regulator [Tepidisphaeraceae bacterium]|jgi:hypothetical protein
MNQTNGRSEYDFSLVIDGVCELTTEVENALFEAGCDDATFSIQYGHLYAEFSREAGSLKDAILSAIKDVRRAGVGAAVICVDESNLVTQAEIARRIRRSRQMVSQYISGQRGPGNFPPPECHLSEGAPLWTWCAVSQWLAENDIIRREESWNAEVVAAINNSLEAARQQARNPGLVKEIAKKVKAAS